MIQRKSNSGFKTQYKFNREDQVINEKIILDIVNQVKPELFWMFLKLAGVGVIFLVIKGYIERIAVYLQFRWDKNLNVGVKVFVRGQEGVIENYTLSSIFVKTKDRTIIINMHRWVYEGFALMNQDDKQKKLN